MNFVKIVFTWTGFITWYMLFVIAVGRVLRRASDRAAARCVARVHGEICGYLLAVDKDDNIVHITEDGGYIYIDHKPEVP